MSIPLYHTFFCPSNLGGWHFYKEKLTGEDVLKMSDEDLLKITMSTLKDDMVIILDSPEEGAEYISEEKQNTFQQIMQ